MHQYNNISRMKFPKYLLSLLLAAMLSLQVLGYEISLGNFIEKTHKSIRLGSYDYFTIRFFNLGNDPIKLKIKAEYDPELIVNIQPSELVLNSVITNNPKTEGEWFILNDGLTYVKVYPIKIKVRVPTYASKRRYNIKVTATAYAYNSSLALKGIHETLAQTREYTLVVDVINDIKSYEAKSEDLGYDVDFGPRKIKASKNISESSLIEKDAGSISNETKSIKPENAEWKVLSSEDKKEKSLIYSDEKGNTYINLPTGKLVITESQKTTAIDLSIIILGISIIYLVVKILR